MSAAEETTKPRRQLTAKQWAEAEALWQAGDVTLADLAAKFGCHQDTFKKHFRKKGIQKGEKKDEHKKKVADAVAEAAVNDATVLAARIRETKEQHYTMSAALARMSFSEILEAKRNGSPVSIALNNLKALDSAMNVLKKAREERYAVLGLDRQDYVDEEGLPELVISELTAEQIAELRNRNHTEFDDIEGVSPVQVDAADSEIVEEGDDDGS